METAGELLAGVVVGDGVAVVLTLVVDVLDGVDEVLLLLLVLVLVVLVLVEEAEVEVVVTSVVDAALEKLVEALAVTDETPVTPEIVKRAE